MKRSLSFVAVVALAACNKAGGEQIEKKMIEIFKGQGITATAVKCPSQIDVKVGGTFTCQATFDSGETLPVEGTITSKDGANFQYSIEIKEPNYVAAKLEQMIVEGITQQRTAPKSVTCGAPGVHRSPTTGSLDCIAVDDQDRQHRVVFKFDDKGQAANWEVVD